MKVSLCWDFLRSKKTKKHNNIIANKRKKEKKQQLEIWEGLEPGINRIWSRKKRTIGHFGREDGSHKGRSVLPNSVTTLQNKPPSRLKIAKYESISTKKRLIRPKWKKQHKCGYKQFIYRSQLLVTLNNYISNKQGTLSWEPSRARNWDEFSLPRTLSVCFLRGEATLTHLKFKLVLSLNNNMTAIWNVVTVII